MIRTVIRLKDGAVMVFDARGEQVKAYQGQYDSVKGKILEDAPPDTVFLYWFGINAVPQTVGREEW